MNPHENLENDLNQYIHDNSPGLMGADPANVGKVNWGQLLLKLAAALPTIVSVLTPLFSNNQPPNPAPVDPNAPAP